MPQNLDPTTNAQATHPKQWRVLFPNDDMNPCLPSNPGEPGMVFANRFEILDGESWTVFRKVEKSKPVLWVMDGEYVFTQCEAPLSGEEFGRQSDVVKKSWGSHILGARRCQSYVEIHARVYLRLKYPGEEITKERLDKAVSEIRKTNKEQPAKVQSRDVINALTCGEEVINILVMQCVGYDYAFEAEMREKMDEFVPSKGKGKGKGKSRAKPGPKSARSKPKPKAPVARRREEASDSGDDDPDAMEVEEIVRERRRSGRFVANAGSVVDRDGAEEEEESDGDGEDDDYAE
ncbi:hypothetical protein JAAARDRAFT_306417 [Jaapia argillacea MUCL 33604]|uniref:DUF6697 domain-containing protein n=1 Tax=Jaapia argillacea MUCL 33604 TaxID=933084 RepID=A0A067Q0Y0_9AGAM|nr:hypothetical protein JAAARDRAFT_306417 [Jaapia argillacea MUCL 33604]